MRPLSVLALCLAALPLLGQPSTPKISAVTSVPIRTIMKPAAASPDDYLFVRVPTPAAQEMEVRFMVDGSMYIEEILDLTAPYPRPKQARVLRHGVVGRGGDQPDPRKAVAVELLAMNLPEVKALRELAQTPGRVAVEISFDGKQARTASLWDLIEESATLRGTADLTVVRSEVTGPGIVPKHPEVARPKVKATEYLESCTQCTSEMPCDTECGYDPGKGGPVTCGEQGYCGSCPPERQLDDYWTVTAVAYGPTSTSQMCIVLYGPSYWWFQEYQTTYRHDHIHYIMVCYDSPNCVSCWPEERVVESYYTYETCWDKTENTCNPNQVPYGHIACDILCQYWGGCESD